MTDHEDADAPSMRVVQFVADRRDADPMDLEPLGHVLDPDALDSLVESFDDDEYLRIEYEGLVLYVWGDGEITASEG